MERAVCHAKLQSRLRLGFEIRVSLELDSRLGLELGIREALVVRVYVYL